ncbi:tetratricopeptide repeat-containing serine/threonine-protein kinase [Planctomycetota bacterium]|nr:tetratricopeptide repeat-containing serine/threonine-protein kinase [Planctomycetota bacterium]
MSGNPGKFFVEDTENTGGGTHDLQPDSGLRGRPPGEVEVDSTKTTSHWHSQLRWLSSNMEQRTDQTDLRLMTLDQLPENVMTLQDGVALTRSDPSRKWDVLLIGGMHTLVSEFAVLARSFSYLYESGVPVSAISPDAILMGSDRRLYIVSNRLQPKEEQDLDEVAARIAPEVLLASHDSKLNESQIVYALAVLLHECVLGSPPWSGRDATEVADRLLSGVCLLDQSEVPLNPPGLKGLLRDSLAIDPARRPGTLKGFASMLEAVRDGERPRSRSRSGSLEPPRLWRLRVALFGVLLVIAALIGRFAGTEETSFDMSGELAKVMLVRPLPLHGEEPPVDPFAIRLFLRYELRARSQTQDPEVQRQFAWVSLRAGRNQLARTAAQYATRIEPGRPGSWVVMGISAIELGDSGGVIEIERGLELEPLDEFDRWSLVAGNLYLLRFDKALEELNRMVVADSGDADLWFHKALCEMHMGDLKSARTSIDRCRKLNPLDGWNDWLFAEIAHADGRIGVTRETLEISQARLHAADSLALRTASLWDRLGSKKTANDWLKRSRKNVNDWQDIEWRRGGRIVLPKRAILFLGPLAPPETSKKTSE